MQSNTQERLAMQIATGWVMLLLILTVSMVAMIVSGILDNDNFSVIRKDPGSFGLKLLIYVFSFYAIMPMVILFAQRLEIKAVRWIVFAVTVFLFLFFFIHHLSHWQSGERETFNSHVLELAHHSIALWTIYLTFMWARSSLLVAANRARD